MDYISCFLLRMNSLQLVHLIATTSIKNGVNCFKWVLREDSAITQVVHTNAFRLSKSYGTIEWE